MRVESAAFQRSLAAGRGHFDAGRYFEAHEAWEEGWKATRGAEKKLLQVLVLWTTALHHAQRANQVGAVALMARALERLAEVTTARPPFDLEALRDALVESWEGLSAPGGPPPPRWSPEPRESEARVELTHRSRCPYCGEPVAVEVEPGDRVQYVEDCPVCCRPWTVSVRDEGGRLAISIGRDDD
jgi:hypothetical protein